MGHAIRWKEWRVGRDPSRWKEGMNIGFEISDFFNKGRDGEEVQAGVMKRQNSTWSL